MAIVRLGHGAGGARQKTVSDRGRIIGCVWERVLAPLSCALAYCQPTEVIVGCATEARRQTWVPPFSVFWLVSFATTHMMWVW